MSETVVVVGISLLCATTSAVAAVLIASLVFPPASDEARHAEYERSRQFFDNSKTGASR